MSWAFRHSRLKAVVLDDVCVGACHTEQRSQESLRQPISFFVPVVGLEMQSSTFVGGHPSTLEALARTQQLSSTQFPVSSDRKVWVGSVPACVSEQELRATLSRYGTISEFFCKADSARLSRGWKWALVTYSSVGEAKFAIDQLNGSSMFSSSDRPLEARFANVKDGSATGLTPRVPVTNTTETSAETAAVSSLQATQNSSNAPADSSGTGFALRPGMGSHHFMDLKSRETKGVVPTADVQSASGEEKRSCSQVKLEKGGRSLWQIYHTPTQVPYYYNSVTRHVQWERPIPPKEHPEAQGQYRQLSGVLQCTSWCTFMFCTCLELPELQGP